MHKTVLFSVVFLANSITHAHFSVPGMQTQQLNALAMTDKTLAQTGLSINENDITSDQDANKLTLT